MNQSIIEFKSGNFMQIKNKKVDFVLLGGIVSEHHGAKVIVIYIKICITCKYCSYI